ncbi:MAG: CHASE2 domain-containing protein [Rhodospirillaceae bacterium]|nr:CHASE2 domain-containing protein [Rhodospirillaceae bacterium]
MRDTETTHLYNCAVHTYLTGDTTAGGQTHVVAHLVSLAVIACTFVGLALYAPHWVQAIRLAVFDGFQMAVPREQPADPVIVVDIDEESLERNGSWPWSRYLIARLVDRLAERGAAVIGLQMVFPEVQQTTLVPASGGWDLPLGPPPLATAFPNLTPDGDLGRALRATTSVVGLSIDGADVAGPGSREPLASHFAVMGEQPAGLFVFPGLLRNHADLEPAPDGLGVMLLAPEPDGVARRIPLLVDAGGGYYPNFALELLRASLDTQSYIVRTNDQGRVLSVDVGDDRVETDANGSVWIHFSDAEAPHTIPAWLMLLQDDPVLPGSLDGRTVLVGSSAAGVGRIWVTSRREPATETDVMAQAFENLRDGTYLTRPPWAVDTETAGLLAIAALFVAFQVRRRGLAVIVAASVSLLVLLWAASLGAFFYGVLIDPSLLTLLVLALLAHSLAFHYLTARSGEAFARSADVFMRQITEHLSEAVLVLDRDGRILSANEAGVDLVGAQRIGRPSDFQIMDHLWRPETGQTSPLGLPATADLAVDPGFDDARLDLGNGRTLDVQVAVSMVPGPRNSAMVLTIHDVTSRREAEKQWNIANRRFREAVENIDQGFALWDANGRLVMHNRAFPDLFGRAGAPIDVGMAAGDVPEEYRELTDRVLAICHATRGAVDDDPAASFELSEFEDRATGRWLLVTHAETAEGGCVSFYSDISELKRREIQLIDATVRIERQAEDLTRFANEISEAHERAKSARIQAERANQAKSDFLAMMSHELRTPLNAILGFADMMISGIHGPVENVKYQEYVELIRQSGEKLLRNISDILDLSKIEAGHWQDRNSTVNLKDCVSDWLRILNRQIEAQTLQIEVHIDPDPLEIWLDRRLLDQIIGNLISNAVKFTPTGGEISIRAEKVGGTRIDFSVSDTGIGIAPEHIPTVLSPFGQIEDQMTRRFEGTGLGLPLAKLSAERLGGTLEIESEVGVGTTVYVSLPYFAPETPLPQRSAART